MPALAAGAAIRSQAAAWIADQVSGYAMVACDPGMCAALQAQGIPAGRLLLWTGREQWPGRPEGPRGGTRRPDRPSQPPGAGTSLRAELPLTATNDGVTSR